MGNAYHRNRRVKDLDIYNITMHECEARVKMKTIDADVTGIISTTISYIDSIKPVVKSACVILKSVRGNIGIKETSDQVSYLQKCDSLTPILRNLSKHHLLAIESEQENCFEKKLGKSIV